MSGAFGQRGRRQPSPSRTLVDPRAPRFGQAVTATVLLAGVVFGVPSAVYAIAVILGLAVISGWRLDLYGLVWKFVLIPLVGRPPERESAAPHRFAKLLGAVGTAIASVLLLANLPLAGYAVAFLVAALAGLAATTGFCLGCRMYREVSVLQRIGVV